MTHAHDIFGGRQTLLKLIGKTKEYTKNDWKHRLRPRNGVFLWTICTQNLVRRRLEVAAEHQCGGLPFQCRKRWFLSYLAHFWADTCSDCNTRANKNAHRPRRDRGAFCIAKMSCKILSFHFPSRKTSSEKGRFRCEQFPTSIPVLVLL